MKNEAEVGIVKPTLLDDVKAPLTQPAKLFEVVVARLVLPVNFASQDEKDRMQ